MLEMDVMTTKQSLGLAWDEFDMDSLDEKLNVVIGAADWEFARTQ
jgi:hypothetical protein